MSRIDGLGAWRPGDFLRNLQGGAGPGAGESLTPGGGPTGDTQRSATTTSSRSVSMTNISAQMGEMLSSGSAGPQQTQMIQALVALMILIALLEQLQQGTESGAKLLDALSSGRASGGAAAGSYFASSYVAYEQTTVTMTMSSGDAGAAGEQAPDQPASQSQIDVSA